MVGSVWALHSSGSLNLIANCRGPGVAPTTLDSCSSVIQVHMFLSHDLTISSLRMRNTSLRFSWESPMSHRCLVHVWWINDQLLRGINSSRRQNMEEEVKDPWRITASVFWCVGRRKGHGRNQQVLQSGGTVIWAES